MRPTSFARAILARGAAAERRRLLSAPAPFSSIFPLSYPPTIGANVVLGRPITRISAAPRSVLGKGPEKDDQSGQATRNGPARARFRGHALACPARGRVPAFASVLLPSALAFFTICRELACCFWSLCRGAVAREISRLGRDETANKAPSTAFAIRPRPARPP